MAGAAILIIHPCAGFPFQCAERSLSPREINSSRLPDLHHHTITKGFSKVGSLCVRNSPIRAVVVDSGEVGSYQTIHEAEPKRYNFLVANAKFMLDEEEHFQELLFEKRRNYEERNKDRDFWLVIEPKFLDQFPDITKRLKRPAVALVSTDDRWIKFMKLRLDRVLAGNYESESIEEALSSDVVDLKFEKPEKWVAPYPKYKSGWWDSFLPPPFITNEP